MFRRTVLRSGLLALPALAGCRALAHETDDLRIMVPNAPGSGYDITARTVATALDISGIRRGVEVFNLPGGQGTVGLQRLVYERGNQALMMLMGLGLIGARLKFPPTQPIHTEITPIARLIEEPEVVVVTPDSPLSTLGELVKAWAADPPSIVVGGGSSPGGPDHLASMLMAKAIGIPPAQVRYARHDGGGALLAAILARQVTFAVSSMGEYASQIRAGQLRVLAITSDTGTSDTGTGDTGTGDTRNSDTGTGDTRNSDTGTGDTRNSGTGKSDTGARDRGVHAPTLREFGVDVVFANWRGLVAPPGLAAEDEEALRHLVASLERCAPWREAIDAHGWAGAYLAGEDFGAFLERERQRVAQILKELGVVP